jgi:ribosomal protein S12 methylthiotransferase accessory factor YcaO
MTARRPAAGRRNEAGSTVGGERRRDLDRVLSGLQAAGCGDAVWVDLSRPDIGLPVGRVVVPGLEGPWTGDALYVPGARANRMSAR